MRSATFVFVASASATLIGCGGGSAHSATQVTADPPSATVATVQARPSAAPVKVAITPGHGGADARPDRGVTIRATGGELTHISVRHGNETVAGTLNAAKTVWRTRWALAVSRKYTIVATATGPSGKTTTGRRTIRTLTPRQTFAPRTIMADHGTYGVGMPLIFYFDGPVKKRKAVERALELKTSRPIVGSWYWDDTCGIVPTCLYFRPKRYWKPHTTVHFTAHVNGVRFGPGVFGDHDLSGTINIGRRLEVIASTTKHSMKLYKNHKQIAHWPISTGKPGDDTPNGTYLSIEKGNPVEMKGTGYDLSVPYSVRITWSGIYLHAAPWSVGAQGSSNVSHGCINLSPE
ncbi:MAG: hypothetical protein JWM31_155, partial [Solirubrobacterales bacterium]|nr:hypothetical protein [Solirubrobacterales bacterium]